MGFFSNLELDINNLQPDTQAILKYLEQINLSLQALTLKSGIATSVGAIDVQTQSYTSHYFLTLPEPVSVTPATYTLPKPADAVIFSSNVDIQVEFDQNVTESTPILSAYQIINVDLKVLKTIQYKMPKEFVASTEQSFPTTPLSEITGNAFVYFFYY